MLSKTAIPKNCLLTPHSQRFTTSAPFAQQRVRILLVLLAILLMRAPSAYAIAGGANANTLKGQVQIFEITDGKGTLICSGSLIAPTWVLTAAHCVANAIPSNYALKVGSLQLGQIPGEGDVYVPVNIYQNPNGYDAALLKLGSAVPDGTLTPILYGTGIPPIETSTTPGGSIMVQGWGGTNNGPPSAVLQTSTHQVTQSIRGRLYIAPTAPIPGAIQRGDSGAGYIFYGTVCGVQSQAVPPIAYGPATDSLAGWIQEVSGVAPAPNRLDGSQACEFPREQRTCDIYDAGGSQCVAAYSMVRSIYNRDNMQMRLYQVTRDLDGLQLDIVQSLTNGYADSAAQDAFCAISNCTVTKIYDQSPFGNDLTIEQGGGAKHSPDSGATANALPIMINGQKVYGLSVIPGVGYRNDTTLGVSRNVGPPPVNKTPEGMYMVTSGKNVNGDCCFDFGNAETNNQDNHEGHMDALNFGTFCGFPPCSGSGPWVEADLENGQYMGGGSDPSNLFNISLTGDFVVAMLKNDSQSTFSLAGGNLQSDQFFRLYNGSLPTQKPGYVPMQLEGAVVLGTGGDNSAGGVGSFFEGAMTTGYPTDATEQAVWNNVVAAGYSGNSSPTNGEAASYTGPSDPNGPGPQDGFEQPSDEQPNDLMGSKPAMAYFNGKIYAAFQANDTSHKLFVTSTTNGTPYPAATGYPGIQIGSAPAMAEFKHQLFVAFQANDASHQLFTTSSSTGVDFPDAIPHPDILIGSAPALAAFRHELFVAFQANDPSHTLFVSSSPDGQSFPPATPVPNVQIGSAPALAVFRSQLFVAFRANDASNDVWVASSTDGFHFSSQRIAGPVNPQQMGPDSSPALVVSNNVLYCLYGAQDLANEMLVMATTDGVNWQGPKAYLNDKMGATGPGATALPVGLTVGFQSNDSRNVLFTSFKHTEALTYTGPSDPGGSGPQDGFQSPALEQTNDFMGSKPAFLSVPNNILLAFQANDPSDFLYVASTQFGENYPAAKGYSNIQMGSAPALAAFGQVYLAFQADDATDDLFVTSSPDLGSTWPTARQIPNVKIGGAPAMVKFNNNLLVAFQADDSSHNLFVASSSDGQKWPSATRVPNVKIGSDPAVAVLNNTLYVAFRADDPSNATWIASSSDGVNFHSQLLPGQMNGSSSPALVSYNGTLYYIYGANDLADEMLVFASTDGTTWQGPKLYPNIQMGSTGPAAAPYAFFIASPVPKVETGITIGFQSDDSRNVLFTTVTQ